MINFFYQRKKALISIILSLAVLANLFVPLLEKPANNYTAFAQGMGFFPEYPERLKYVMEELKQASQDLVYLNQELKNETEQCSCQNANSQCGRNGGSTIKVFSPDVFGDPCPNRKEVEQAQVDVKNKAEQVSFLKELLEQEMEAGLEAELKTLREDEANELKSGLENLVNYSDNISASALDNAEILNNENYSVEKQCAAQCGTGSVFELKACILSNTGKQDPITMEFEVGAGLTDLDLGEVRIDEIELNLPAKIEISDIVGIEDFQIDLNDIVIDFPPTPVADLGSLHLDPIVFHPPSPEIPQIAPIGFSCSEFSANAYQYQEEGGESSGYYIDLEWYLQTFSWLSEKCNDISTMKDENGLPTEKVEQCFDKNNVHLTIVEECDGLWEDYFVCLAEFAGNPLIETLCPPPSGICASIKSPGERDQAEQRECANLFNQLGEPVPGNCNLTVLENKCDQLKEAGKEEVPEPCKFLPIFTKEMEVPEGQTYETSPNTSPAQTISDIPETAIRLDCPSLPSIGSTALPKIKLPDIIIPDIELPDFSFMPFIKIDLPSFIFEDLILPDLNLCDFDACQGIIEPMNIDVQYPSLMIPTIEIPPFYISLSAILGLPGINDLPIVMDDIEFPPIPFGLPGFDLNHYISLNMDLPEISLPQPEIILNFNGVKINAFNILLGLVASLIPIPSGCISFSISFIPLVISFPNYYFYWPKFPEIPNLCDNKYISINQFCQNVKDSLAQVYKRMDEIEDLLNITIQTQLQDQLNKVAATFEQVIRESIYEQLEEIKQKIEQAIGQSIAAATIEDDILKIPSAIVPLEGITVLTDKINDEIAKIPLSITIPWPKDLERIKLTDPIAYKLPSIPLSGLSFTKSVLLKLPGFQLPSFSFSLGIDYPSCESGSPSGGNPYPMNEINVNLGEITGFSESINQTSEKINQILP